MTNLVIRGLVSIAIAWLIGTIFLPNPANVLSGFVLIVMVMLFVLSDSSKFDVVLNSKNSRQPLFSTITTKYCKVTIKFLSNLNPQMHYLIVENKSPDVAKRTIVVLPDPPNTIESYAKTAFVEMLKV